MTNDLALRQSILDVAWDSLTMPATIGGPSLALRIAHGQRSVMFAHQADYAASTADGPQPSLQPFERATHNLADTRLMIAWAQALNAYGEPESAPQMVDRLRGFRSPGLADFVGVRGVGARAGRIGTNVPLPRGHAAAGLARSPAALTGGKGRPVHATGRRGPLLQCPRDGARRGAMARARALPVQPHSSRRRASESSVHADPRR
jgi:hypothetical protein